MTAIANCTLIEHEHHSSRFDRSMRSLDDYIETASKRANIITTTEVGNNVRDNALRGHKDFDVAQVEGPRGMSECAIVYNRNFFEPTRKPYTIPLAHQKGIGGEDTIQMVVGTFESYSGRIRVGAFHGPARIESPLGFRRSEPLEVKAHKEMMLNMRLVMARWERAQYLDGWLISGDINLNVRKLWVQNYLRKELPSFVDYNWRNHLPPVGGTHAADRVIDLTFYSKRKLRMLKTGLSTDDRSSDHRPYFGSYVIL
jgi:hypothetical protein